MWRFILVLGLASAWPAAALAGTWRDPSFTELAGRSELVALLRYDGSEPAGAEPVSMRVEKIYVGQAPAGELRLAGLHDPERERPAKLEPGARFVAFLSRRGELWGPPSPTYGLFPVRAEGVVASLRDTSVRVSVPLPRFEDYIRAVTGALRSSRAAPAEWLAQLRRRLDEADFSKPSAASAADWHLSLEALWYFAEAKDFGRIQRALSCELFQIRASACRALSRIGGAKAGAALVERALGDPTVTVCSWAALALARATKPAPGVAEAVIAGLDRAPIREVRLAGSIEDPRINVLPSARATLLELLGRWRTRAALPALRASLTRDDPALIEAALRGLLAFGERRQLKVIISKMRQAKDKGFYYNRLFAKALSGATGEDLGVRREAWEKWWQESQATPERAPARKKGS